MNSRDIGLLYENIRSHRANYKPGTSLSGLYFEKLVIRRTPLRDFIDLITPALPKEYEPVFNNGTHKEDLRIYLNVNADDYIDALEDIAKRIKKIKNVKNVSILESHKDFSSKFRTIKFDLAGVTKYIVLTYSKSLSGGMDTDVKEGIIGLLWANFIGEAIDLDDDHVCKEVFNILLEGKGNLKVEGSLNMSKITCCGLYAT